MSESKIKSGRKRGYFVLFRSAAQDARLSLEARGLFALMGSLPEDWEYTVSGLAAKAGCGREKTRRLLKELQTVGYLIREQSHDGGGKFGGNVYVLQDEAPPLPENPSNGGPEKAPLPQNTVNGENRQREMPLTEFRPQQNIDLTEYPPKAPQGAAPAGKRRRGREPKAGAEWKPERFEAFWSAYPCGKNRQAAIRAWDKLRPEDGLLEQMALGLKRALASEDWQRGIGIPYAATWLNNQRWTDLDKPLPAPEEARRPKPAAPRPYHTELIDGEEVVIYDD